MAHGQPARLTAGEGRRFAFTLAGAFAVLGAITWWRGHPGAATVFGSLALALALGGTFVPTSLGPAERAWMGLAHLISKVTTPILMGVVYFLVLTPISLLMALVGRRPLRVRRGVRTFWSVRPDDARRSDLTRQF